jgi:heme exporter protein D
MSGVVVGGWEFVWAAYGITGAAFAIYVASLVSRLRKAERHD